MGWDERADSKVRIAVTGFIDDSYQPHKALLSGIVLESEGTPDHGVDPVGSHVIVSMERGFRDGNRLIRDLIHGAEGFGVARCEAGSVVEFVGCEFVNFDEIEAKGYTVVSASPDIDVPTPREGFVADMHAAPSPAA